MGAAAATAAAGGSHTGHTVGSALIPSGQCRVIIRSRSRASGHSRVREKDTAGTHINRVIDWPDPNQAFLSTGELGRARSIPSHRQDHSGYWLVS